MYTNVTPVTVEKFIDLLKCNCSPGGDGITSEHLAHGKSPTLLLHLSTLYSVILSWCIVPDLLTTGVIVPILKKPTLNPNRPDNFRPITLSSIYSKLLEILVLPEDIAFDSQFGFRQGRGTSFSCALLNDTAVLFNDAGSPLYVCSLDAEKCFDNIWHPGLFYKLWGNIPTNHWLILYKWYSNLKSVVKWDGHVSQPFRITRGERQSILSPQLFNIFINDLLKELDESDRGVRFGSVCLGSFAYADDVTLFSASVTGLQSMVDICAQYAQTWCFRLGIKKSHCMTFGKNVFKTRPSWYLGDKKLKMLNQWRY
jgi:hypothetical protein